MKHVMLVPPSKAHVWYKLLQRGTLCNCTILILNEVTAVKSLRFLWLYRCVCLQERSFDVHAGEVLIVSSHHTFWWWCLMEMSYRYQYCFIGRLCHGALQMSHNNVSIALRHFMRRCTREVSCYCYWSSFLGFLGNYLEIYHGQRYLNP